MRRVKTQVELAKALGVNDRTVRGYLKRHDWPFGRSDFDVASVRRWCAANLRASRNGNGSPSHTSTAYQRKLAKLHEEEASAKLELAIESTLIMRLKRRRMEDEFIPRAIHDALMCETIRQVRDRIEEMVESFPSILESKPAHSIRMTLRDWYDRLCGDMASRESVTVTIPEKGKNRRKSRAAHRRHATPVV